MTINIRCDGSMPVTIYGVPRESGKENSAVGNVLLSTWRRRGGVIYRQEGACSFVDGASPAWSGQTMAAVQYE